MEGARSKLAQGVITPEQFDEIETLVAVAPSAYYRPLMYLISFSKVKKRLKLVPLMKKALLMGMEYLVPELPWQAFDVIKYDVIH